MNIFTNLARKERASDTSIGPADHITINRRHAAFAEMTGGRGFRQWPKPPRKAADGTTRGDRKRAARAHYNAKVSEQRAPEFMHSAARLRFGLVHVA